MEAEKVYRRILRIANTVSVDLRQDIRSVGPLWLPDREDRGLAMFLARAVIGQQLSAKAARSIWERIERMAREMPGGFSALLREQHTERLQACGVSRNKIKALVAINQARRNRLLERRRLIALDHAQRSTELIKIWGIGQWTCDMTSIFYFKDANVWPRGDTAVTKTLAKYLGDATPDEASVSKVAEKFSPYRSILALYMWRIVDATPE